MDLREKWLSFFMLVIVICNAAQLQGYGSLAALKLNIFFGVLATRIFFMADVENRLHFNPKEMLVQLLFRDARIDTLM